MVQSRSSQIKVKLISKAVIRRILSSYGLKYNNYCEIQDFTCMFTGTFLFLNCNYDSRILKLMYIAVEAVLKTC